MLNRVHQNPKVYTVFVTLVLCILILVGHLSVQTDSKVSAQENTKNMKTLMLRMNEMRRNDPGFVFIVGFVNPLVKNEPAWTIGDTKDSYKRTVDEVGEDYVCFREHTEAADLVRCTPFYNILDVTYVQT